MKIIVVGAGPAGLAATYQLKKQGMDVTTYEGSPYAGGRARGYFKNGYLIDVGAQFAGPFYTTTVALMRELGEAEELHPFKFKTGVWRNGKLYPMTTSMSPKDQLANLPDLLRFRGASLKTSVQSLKMFPGLAKLYRKVDYANWDFSRLLDMDHLSVADYTLQHGGKDALEYLFQPLTAYLTLGEPEEVSMSHFLAICGFFVQGIWSFERGIGQVCRSLHAACEDKVKLSTPVKRIVIEEGAVKGVEIDGGLIEADAVICAVSSVDALKMMPNLPECMRQCLHTVKYSSTSHITFGLEKRLLPDGWYSLVIPRSAGFVTTGPVDSSAKSPYYTPGGKGGLVHCLTYGKKAQAYMRTPDAELKRIMIEDIRRVMPQMPDKPPLAEVHRWNEAVCLQSPGQYPAVLKLKNEYAREVRGLFLAGDYMSLFSSVEAALRSGLYAAGMAVTQ
ncbi:MAG TPA: NAD(P)/FAD-dependent oxidoreductase [Deltaproteobacteria bacterium]|nr:NAD(P)/FAD-dependent oxidoreductase [Deltaproteobacteria bacterium]